MAQSVATLRKLTSQTTLTVTVNLSREFRARKAVALFLIRLASSVIGCGFEVVDNDTPRDDYIQPDRNLSSRIKLL
jgi:hypothetical protein